MIYEYNLTDHLGNTRITFGDSDADGDADILQENHYYPFGMAMTMGSASAAAPPNDYLYNGKELQDELGLDWYDYGARMYDASIGRWNGVDAMAESNPNWTPYRYGFNNPIIFTDPTGNIESHYVDEEGNYLGEDNTGSTDVRVIKNEVWQSVANTGSGTDMSDVGTKAVKAASTDLSEYRADGGINITAETWDQIEEAGGERLSPTIENNSSGEVFAIDDNSKIINGRVVNEETGGPGDLTPFRVDPGKQSYVPIDGVKTYSMDGGGVYKVSDGERVEILKGGLVDVVERNSINRIGGMMYYDRTYDFLSTPPLEELNGKI